MFEQKQEDVLHEIINLKQNEDQKCEVGRENEE